MIIPVARVIDRELTTPQKIVWGRRSDKAYARKGELHPHQVGRVSRMKAGREIATLASLVRDDKNMYICAYIPQMSFPKDIPGIAPG